MEEQIGKSKEEMIQIITQAEIIFCLAYYGTGGTTEEVIDKCNEMKYSLSAIKMLENGDLEYDSKKKEWRLTEQGRKVAEELHGLKGINKLKKRQPHIKK